MSFSSVLVPAHSVDMCVVGFMSLRRCNHLVLAVLCPCEDRMGWLGTNAQAIGISDAGRVTNCA